MVSLSQLVCASSGPVVLLRLACRSCSTSNTSSSRSSKSSISSRRFAGCCTQADGLEVVVRTGLDEIRSITSEAIFMAWGL